VRPPRLQVSVKRRVESYGPLVSAPNEETGFRYWMTVWCVSFIDR